MDRSTTAQSFATRLAGTIQMVNRLAPNFNWKNQDIIEVLTREINKTIDANTKDLVAILQESLQQTKTLLTQNDEWQTLCRAYRVDMEKALSAVELYKKLYEEAQKNERPN